MYIYIYFIKTLFSDAHNENKLFKHKNWMFVDWIIREIFKCKHFFLFLLSLNYVL